MLHRITFEFAVPSEVRFQSYSGFEVKGFFYSTLSSVDQALASSIHAGKALAPFAVTPVFINRAGRQLTCYDRLSPGLASFSFILFRDDEARVIEEALRRGLSTVRLADHELPLLSVRVEQLDLLPAAEVSANSFSLEFYTPTYFRATPVDLAKEYSLKAKLDSPYRFVPLPDPILLFRSLIRTWREFFDLGIKEPESFMSWVESGGVLLSGFPRGIRTRRVYEHPMTNKWAVGFTGTVYFSFSSKLFSEEMVRTAYSLLKFGEITGVGAGRTSGMGRYRMNVKDNEDSIPEGEERDFSRHLGLGKLIFQGCHRIMTLVIDLRNNRRVVMKAVDVESVRLEDDFWLPRLKVMWDVTLPSQLEIFEKTGRLHNFRRAAGKEDGDFIGLLFNDSDVYKWLEAVSYSYAYTRREDLRRMASRVVDDVVDAQEEDGYIDTYFVKERKAYRWKNERDNHELYCAGHLMQAGIASRRSGMDERLFLSAKKFADLIYELFGPGKAEIVPGHPVIEMASVELYRETGDKRYLELAERFLNLRGRGIIGGMVHHLDHVPIREMRELSGHAVRALYLMGGVTDVYAENGDLSLFQAATRLWEDLQKKTYVTGGVGSRHEGESIGEAYELPNSRAYAETCAAVASVLWNHRMLLLTGEEKYADAMELALYNGALSGISLDGLHYFYVNPLADRGKTRRQEWFDCACCPTNIIRLLSYLPGFFYGLSNDGVYVNLYARSTANIRFNGRELIIKQETDFPWDGKVRLYIDKADELILRLRIPAWARGARLRHGSQELEARPGSYAKVSWREGQEIELDMPMPVERIVANPRVICDRGSVALKRGPLVYCVEESGNGFDPWDLALGEEEELKAQEGSISGLKVIVIKGRGELLEGLSETYVAQRDFFDLVKRRQVDFEAIPYYAWGNRERGPMTVWIKQI